MQIDWIILIGCLVSSKLTLPRCDRLSLLVGTMRKASLNQQGFILSGIVQSGMGLSFLTCNGASTVGQSPHTSFEHPDSGPDAAPLAETPDSRVRMRHEPRHLLHPAYICTFVEVSLVPSVFSEGQVH